MFRSALKVGFALMMASAITGCSSPSLPPIQARSATASRLEATWKDGKVFLHWQGKGPVTLWRSTSPWGTAEGRLPQSEFVLNGTDSFVDEWAAAATTYYYALVAEGGAPSTTSLAIPAQRLPSSAHPRLLVDKHKYTLEVWEKVMLKRYPIAMGALPQKRKLCFDQASTPEGRYHITGAQPQATYYRAYDLDYPNRVDRARFQLLSPGQPIGGEIQIHGKGIERNWTWGCLAMRNEDIDELFAHPEIGVGTEIYIFGGELTLEDVRGESPWSPLELGQRQKAAGLKVTCVWDRASRNKLGTTKR